MKLKDKPNRCNTCQHYSPPNWCVGVAKPRHTAAGATCYNWMSPLVTRECVKCEEPFDMCGIFTAESVTRQLGNCRKCNYPVHIRKGFIVEPVCGQCGLSDFYWVYGAVRRFVCNSCGTTLE